MRESVRFSVFVIVRKGVRVCVRERERVRTKKTFNAAEGEALPVGGALDAACLVRQRALAHLRGYTSNA